MTTPFIVKDVEQLESHIQLVGMENDIRPWEKNSVVS